MAPYVREEIVVVGFVAVGSTPLRYCSKRERTAAGASHLWCRDVAMFTKCAACNARILAGAKHYHLWEFCSENCVTKFKSVLVDRCVAPDVIAAQIQGVVEEPCPVCGTQKGNDLYSSTRVTGMLIMLRVTSGSRVSCASCARKERLVAFLHCLFLGWWSPKALFINTFVLPTNLLAAILTRQPAAPSRAFSTLVKSRMADAVMPQIVDQISQQHAAEQAKQEADNQGMPNWDPSQSS